LAAQAQSLTREREREREREGMGGGGRRRTLVGLGLAMFLGIAVYFRLWSIDYSVSSDDNELLRFGTLLLFSINFTF
jgi:hypothetical protein